MKIAYLSRGNSVFDSRFLQKMIERGHKPYFISYANHAVVKVNGVETFHYHYSTLCRFGRLRSLQIAWHLRRLLSQLQPDVLHTGWVTDHGFFGALSGFHPTLSMPFGSDVLIRPNDSRICKWKVRFTLKQADAVTCDCELVKDRIVQIASCSPDKVVVFPWGIDLVIFRPSPGPSPIHRALGWEGNEVLIMTRQFKSIYGIEYFIEALPAIVRQRPSVRVILVGAGPMEQTYRNRIAELGLTNHIYFAGWLDEAGMAAHLNAADIYVTTSLSDGTSVSMLEAMACGLPVVVSDVPSYSEWVEDGVNGFIVPRRNSTVLANRLLVLLSDEALRHEMGQRNLKIARERANWEKNFGILEDICLTLTQGRSLRE